MEKLRFTDADFIYIMIFFFQLKFNTFHTVAIWHWLTDLCLKKTKKHFIQLAL